jgi:hypothetical protein
MKALNRLTSALNKPKLPSLDGLIKFLFGGAIALMPIQISLLVYQTTWGRGFQNPYTSIWLYATEILLLAAAILFFIKMKKIKRRIRIGHRPYFIMLLGLMATASLSTLCSPFQDFTFSLLIFSKILGLLLMYVLIVNRTLKASQVLEIFIISMSSQAILAVAQVLLQHSIGFSILGEPSLGAEAAHIARFNFGSHTIIRGYGTFTHPNILGGFLVISLLCSLLFSPHIKHERFILILIQFFGLLATFSRSAMLGLFVGGMLLGLWYLPKLKRLKNKVIPATLITFFTAEFIFVLLSRGITIWSDPAITERIEGFKTSWEMFTTYPWGVGFSHYTLFLDQVSQTALMPWDYQPVHNVFLLTLTELGILGSLVAFAICAAAVRKLFLKRRKLLTYRRLFKKRVFFSIVIAILTISLFDHYFLTSAQGRLLLIMIFAIVSAFSQNPRHMLPIKKATPLNKILADQE